jgi:uncharacterized membrane protein (UPF0127 family)
VRALVVLTLLAELTLACQRVTESPRTREPAGASANDVPPSHSWNDAMRKDPSDEGRCIVPLAPSAAEAPRRADHCPRDPEKSPPLLERGEVSFPEAPNGPTLDVEVARTEEERERGLMYRTNLGPMQGMIFAWSDERLREFWMKNTCIPLDMLYLGRDGTIVGVLEDVPVLNDAPRAVQCKAGYVLEVNAGWSREHGVTPGMKARISL